MKKCAQLSIDIQKLYFLQVLIPNSEQSWSITDPQLANNREASPAEASLTSEYHPNQLFSTTIDPDASDSSPIESWTRRAFLAPIGRVTADMAGKYTCSPLGGIEATVTINVSEGEQATTRVFCSFQNDLDNNIRISSKYFDKLKALPSSECALHLLHNLNETCWIMHFFKKMSNNIVWHHCPAR